jgi:hypothetical protein
LITKEASSSLPASSSLTSSLPTKLLLPDPCSFDDSPSTFEDWTLGPLSDEKAPAPAHAPLPNADICPQIVTPHPMDFNCPLIAPDRMVVLLTVAMDSKEVEVESIFGGEVDEQRTTYDDAQVSVECLG